MSFILLCSAAAQAAPVRPKIDLDAFDNSMKHAQLPNGISLSYIDLGPSNGTPVVLIHGFTNNARNWVPLIPYLDPKLRLILVDLRGHGKSSKPECCYDRIDMAYDVRLLLDQLKVSSANIVGHSLGSIVAQTFAEYWPERTGRVVLIGSTGGVRMGCPGEDGVPSSGLSEMRTALLHMKDPIDPDSQFILNWYGSTKPPDPEVLRRQRIDAAAIPVRVWIAMLDQFAAMNLQGTLPWLKAPTLLIWGDQDKLINDRGRCALREALPNAQVHVFPHYGHNPQWEDPAAVAALINPFLMRGTDH
jgi:pimeloyl-ACP methyl ester carboxylesterase